MNIFSRGLLIVFVIVIGVSLAGAVAVSAARHDVTPQDVAIIVTTLKDELNSDGDCSLREAVEAANTNAALDACASGDVLTDTITFEATGTISLTQQLLVTAGGLLMIDGTDVITISGGGSTRIFSVTLDANLTLQSLSLVNSYSEHGGGIYNNGTLTIVDSTLSGNRARWGGGIFNYYGRLNITNSTVSENHADIGGGVYNNGTLNITESTLSGNSAPPLGGGGGGIDNMGTLTIINTTLSGNNASNGGSIKNGGTLTIINTILSGNNATYGGGGIFNSGRLSITNSTLSGNSASAGGGISNGDMLTITNSTLSGNNAFWGGGIRNYGTLTITDSTLSGNNATYGGGAFNRDTLTITNSTLSGNSANFGGGIDNDYGTLTITNSTLSGNTAVLGSGIVNSNTLTITHSIVANSSSGGDCYQIVQITDGGHNLSSDDTCGFDPANGSLPNTDPLLGPLQSNGGPTWTHALLFGSPAIDAGDDALCPPTDQRGMPRPVDGDKDGLAVCDIGSFEYYIPVNFLPLIVKD